MDKSYVISQGVEIGAGVLFTGRPIISAKQPGKIIIGPRTHLISNVRVAALGINHPVILRTLSEEAFIKIGKDVGMTGGSICAAVGITIGDGTLIGANVTIIDTDFHPIHSTNRRYAEMPFGEPEDEIFIGQNVFLGTSVIILRSTNIGNNCVIGAGSVLKGNYPANSIIVGNPARIIGTVREN